MNELQQYLDRSLQKNADQSSRNHDRIISKAEVGQKKIEEVLKRMNSIDENLVKRSFTEAPLYQHPGLRTIERPLENHVVLNNQNQ